MTFNQVLSGRKFVIVAVTLALLSGFGLGGYPKDLKWNFDNIPEKWRFKLEVSNPNSSKETVEISGNFLTKSVIEKGFGTSWENLGKTFQDNFQKMNERYGSGADTLVVDIIQSSEKSFPFEIYKFALTQGKVQYGWDSHFEIKPFDRTFQIFTYWGRLRAPSLRPGIEASGILPLPDNIDLSKPFTIWYGDYSAKLNAEGLDTEQ